MEIKLLPVPSVPAAILAQTCVASMTLNRACLNWFIKHELCTKLQNNSGLIYDASLQQPQQHI